MSIPISLENETELFLISQKIKELEINLGRIRAVYLAAEQKYLLDRSYLEKEYLKIVKQAAEELNLPFDENQEWEFIPEQKVFKHKKTNE